MGPLGSCMLEVYGMLASKAYELGSVLGSTWVHLGPDMGESAECEPATHTSLDQCFGQLGSTWVPISVNLPHVSKAYELGSVLGSTWIHFGPDMNESAEC